VINPVIPIHEEEEMPDCELFVRSAQPAVTMRATLPVEKLKEFLGRAYCATFGYIGEMGEHPAGMPFACYHNMDMQALDVEAGVPVSRALPTRGEVLSAEIPAGQYAGSTHLGSYESLSVTYEALSKWMAEQGLQPAGVVYEFYHTGPETPPEKTVTQIVFPLKA
jgi:effector-binding domain-containing protein